MAVRRQRMDLGKIIPDPAVPLALGGDGLADIAILAGEPPLARPVRIPGKSCIRATGRAIEVYHRPA